ncbi:DUF3137 domain-containing protein [Campylobacter geochelonis]|uniref:DUF3137 domain-containing protein n=1 Tax=Campylobacter geochelonis TaxID=1780362 RepID=UPI000770B036|nr:DUF3137 domain-containing protein [Campylobacter geochelonis]CZE46182.1 putative Galanin [Campylobacter geochelonis]CZE50759.1 putative Galanin [Campylobacter geochelonis]
MQLINKLEKKRKKLLLKLLIPFISLTLVVVFGFFMMIKAGVLAPLVLLVFIYIFIFYRLKFKVANSFIAFYNEAIFSQISTKFNSLKYSRNPKFSMEKFEPLFAKKVGFFNANDEIRGEFGGVWFSFCDGRLDFSEIGFKGKLFIAEFNKIFLSKVVLRNSGLFDVGKLKMLKTDNVLINKSYEIYCENEIEAMYILSPNLLEKLLVLTDNGAIKADVMFDTNHIYLAVNSQKDSLEPNLFKPINSLETDEFIKEIKSFFELISYLSLDKRIWKK